MQCVKTRKMDQALLFTRNVQFFVLKALVIIYYYLLILFGVMLFPLVEPSSFHELRAVSWITCWTVTSWVCGRSQGGQSSEVLFPGILVNVDFSTLLDNPDSLRGRRSKGKGKGIRARDHARGRREEGYSRREISSRFTSDICLGTQMAWCWFQPIGKRY